MTVNHLRSLLALYSRGTIAAAALDMHLSPAAVSVQLRLLEDELGVALFVRTGRSIRLTAAAYQLLPKAEKLVRAYDELKRTPLAQPVRGVISLGVLNSALLGTFPSVIQRVMAEHEHLQIKVHAGPSPDLVAKVLAGVLDGAIVTCPPTALDEEFIVHPLYTEPFTLVRHARTPFTHLADVLTRQPYIALDRSTWTGRQIEHFLVHRGIHVEPVMELNSQEAILAAVKHGLGVSLLPLIQGWVSDARLGFNQFPEVTRTIGLVERRTHVLSHLTAQILGAYAAVLQDTDPGHPLESADASTAAPSSTASPVASYTASGAPSGRDLPHAAGAD